MTYSQAQHTLIYIRAYNPTHPSVTITARMDGDTPVAVLRLDLHTCEVTVESDDRREIHAGLAEYERRMLAAIRRAQSLAVPVLGEVNCREDAQG